jgi:arsenate reductase-like glutaredoxin family protein
MWFGRTLVNTERLKVDFARMILSNDINGRRDNGLLNGVGRPSKIETIEYPSKEVLKNLDKVFNGNSAKYNAESDALETTTADPFQEALDRIAKLPEVDRVTEYFSMLTMIDDPAKRLIIQELIGNAGANQFVDPLADSDVEELNASFGIPTGNPVSNKDVLQEIRKLIPDITDEELVLAANVISVTDALGNKKEFIDALGLTYKGVVHLLSTDGSVDAQVIRHEAFHKLVNQYLPADIKIKLLNSLKRSKGIDAYKRFIGSDTLTDSQVYEYGALAFQKNLEPKGAIKKLFKWLLDNIVTPILALLGRPDAQVNAIFNAIDNNKYTTRLLPNTSKADFMKAVNKYFPDSSLVESIKDYLVSVGIVKEYMKFYTRNTADITENAAGEYNNLLYTKVEAVDKIINKINSEAITRLSKHFGGLSGFLMSGVKSPQQVVGLIKAIKLLDLDETAKKELIAYVQLQNSFTVRAVIGEIEGSRSDEYLEQLLQELEDADIDSLEKDDIAAERTDFADEIAQNIHSDQEAKITQKLKEFLSLIPSNKGYLTFRFCYAKLLDTLVNGGSEIIYGDSVSTLTKLINDTKDSGTRDIYKALLEMATLKDEYKYRGYTLPKELLFADGNFKYKWISINRGETQSTISFYNKIIESLETEGDEDIKALLTKFPKKVDKLNLLKFLELRGDAADVWGMIATKMASQAYNLPVYDSLHFNEVYNEETDSKKPTTKFRVGRTPLSGVADTYKNRLSASINRLLIQYGATNDIGNYFEGLKKAKYTDVLLSLGVQKSDLSGLNDAQINSIITNLNSIINSLASTKNTKKDDSAVIDLESISASISSNINAIASTLSAHNPFLSSLSYRDANGKLRYVFVMGSWAFYTLNKMAKGLLPSFLLHDNYLSKWNIFTPKKVNGKSVAAINDIYNVVSFDASVTTKNGVPNEYGATQIQDMTPADFYQHRFLNGFLGVVLNRELNKTYYQYTWQQSDRKAELAAEVKMLSRNALEQAFKALQGFNNEQIAQKEKFKHIKNFSERVTKEWYNDITFAEFLGRLKDLAAEDFESFLVEMDYENAYFTNRLENYDQLTKIEDVLQSKNYELVNDKDIAAAEEVIKKYLGDKYSEKKVYYHRLWKAFYAFYVQNYVNGEFLNQIVFGDKAFTESEDNLIKRMLSIQTPFERQYVGETGNRKKAKYVVAKDFKETFGAIEDFDKTRSKITDSKGHDITDGTTFGIPLTLKNMRKGTRNYHLDSIIKIVRVETDEQAVRHYNKTALYIIDDEMARTQYTLAKIRRQMETHGMSQEQIARYDVLYGKLLDGDISAKERYEYEQLIYDNAIEFYFFDSAYKVGAPSKDFQINNGEAIQDKHVFELNNEFLGLQSDPIHDDKAVSQTSQFDYFTNINGLNEDEAFLLYTLNAELNRIKFDIYSIETSIINPDGTVNKKAVAKEIKKAAAKGVSEERIFDLLDNGVSINFPSIEGKSLITIASKVEKNSVGVRHNGKKLVLQTAFGVKVYDTPRGIKVYSDLTREERALANQFETLPYNVRQALTKIGNLMAAEKFVIDGVKVSKEEYLERNRAAYAALFKLSDEETALYNTVVDSLISSNNEYIVPRRLQIRDKDGFTEVIAPRWWAKKLEEIYGEDWPKVKKLYETGMAVRIPTTGIHSAVAIRIIFTAGNKFEDGVKVNRIIAPEELVALHGSDFDVDSLFAMFREVADDLGTAKDGAPITSLKVGEHVIELNKVVGYDNSGMLIPGIEESLKAAADSEESKPTKLIYLELLSKVKKNIKIDNNLGLITAEKNQHDMNTPIAFTPLKEDPFDKIKKGMSAEEVIAALTSYLSTASEDIVSIFPKNLDILDAEALAKGELVIKSNKLKSALLDSNIGLISKLKIISKRTTLKPEKDINRLTTQMRYHRDNYMGKMGVGIQANLMKAVSYLMYGGRFIIDGNEIPLSSIASIKTVYGKTSITTKDGNTYSGTLERPKVALRRPSKTSEGIKYTPIEFKYVIDGKEYVYSHLERRTKHGDKSTAENGDTRINGYVDNVKVGSTPIVNATSLTIDVIGLMDFTGWDFDDVGYFMNQPVMLLLSSSRLKYNSNTTNSKKMLYDKFLELTKKKYDEHELSKTTLSREALTSVIEKYYGRDIRDVITAKDLTPADIATQLKVMEYFAEYKAITKSLFGASAALRLLKSIPTKFEKQLSTASAIQNIEEGMLWFDSPNFLNIPHIEAAANSFKTATNITKEVLPITQDGVIDALRDVAKNTSFSNTSSFAEYSVAQTVNILKDLFRHFLLGKVTEQVAGQGFADAYAEYVGIEIATGS